MSCIYYFLVKRKELLGKADTNQETVFIFKDHNILNLIYRLLLKLSLYLSNSQISIN